LVRFGFGLVEGGVEESGWVEEQLKLGFVGHGYCGRVGGGGGDGPAVGCLEVGD